MDLHILSSKDEDEFKQRLLDGENRKDFKFEKMCVVIDGSTLAIVLGND